MPSQRELFQGVERVDNILRCVKQDFHLYVRRQRASRSGASFFFTSLATSTVFVPVCFWTISMRAGFLIESQDRSSTSLKPSSTRRHVLQIYVLIVTLSQDDEAHLLRAGELTGQPDQVIGKPVFILPTGCVMFSRPMAVPDVEYRESVSFQASFCRSIR